MSIELDLSSKLDKALYLLMEPHIAQFIKDDFLDWREVEDAEFHIRQMSRIFYKVMVDRDKIGYNQREVILDDLYKATEFDRHSWGCSLSYSNAPPQNTYKNFFRAFCANGIAVLKKTTLIPKAPIQRATPLKEIQIDKP